MSADNYYRVCKHPKGGFTAVMGFMSNDERPEPREDGPQFDTWQEAHAYADRDFIIEYGIRVDEDCVAPEATTVEVELAAMNSLVDAFGSLDDAARERVMRWANDRFFPVRTVTRITDALSPS